MNARDGDEGEDEEGGKETRRLAPTMEARLHAASETAGGTNGRKETGRALATYYRSPPGETKGCEVDL